MTNLPIPVSEVPMHHIESSLIEEIGYNPLRLVLQIRFKPKPPTVAGPLYQYANVSSEMWADVIFASSIGKEFSRRIKNNPSIPCIQVVEEKGEPK